MTDIFEHLNFLNNLFTFRLIEELLCNIKFYLFAVKETPNSLASANSTRRRRLKLIEESFNHDRFD